VDLWSLEPITSIENEEFGNINSLAFSPDGKQLAIGSYNNTTRIWTIGTDDFLLTSVHIRPLSLAYSPSGRYLLGAFCTVPNQGNCDKAILQWIDATTGKADTMWQQDDWQEIYDIVFGEDLFFSGGYGKLDVIQISTDERIYQSEEKVFDFLLSPDNRLLFIRDKNRINIYGIP
jgi:WD40 repeat protein